MKAQLTLRRPANWQDFESLCKKLWGEIWACPEIQKNGRLGQDQSGVDIFGIPINDNSYYGIQCKGKSEYNDEQYSHPQFTKQEIDNEILKAKSFKPELKKLYFATTALNDSKIQTYVREKNIEHKSQNLFEVHMFCWETIVDLIDENKQTYDWYVKSQNYKSNQSIAVTFENDEIEINASPLYKKTITHYIQKIVPAYRNGLLETLRQQQAIYKSIKPVSLYSRNINLSYIGFNIKIHNIGSDPIEEYKLIFNFEGNITKLTDSNESSNRILAIPRTYVPTTYTYFETLSGKLIPRKSILVGDDTFKSDRIFIKTIPTDNDVLIKWKLISKDFKDEGQLTIRINPDIKTIYQDILVEDPLQVRTTKSDIEEYIRGEDDE